jgi:hypothetical protein
MTVFRVVVPLAVAAGVSWLAWVGSHVPVMWIAGVSAAVVAIWALLARGRWQRIALVDLALLLTLVAVVEAILLPGALRGDPGLRSLETSHDVVVEHPILGWAPYGPTVRHARLVVDDRVVYDVDYGLDEHGRRMTPAPRADGVAGTFLAFGGSFTFGEGVADGETMPWRVAELTAERWKAVNFGFQGWGAQQMLAALDGGLVAETITGERVEALYQCGFFHVERTAGLVRWASSSPRFVAGGESVRRDGWYPDDLTGPHPWPPVLDRWLLWRRVMGAVRPPDERAVELFGRTVAAARDRVESLAPRARFHLLYWDDEPPWRDGPVLDALRGRDVTVTLASEILPAHDPSMRLDPADAHPSAAAHERVGRWVVDTMLQPTTASEDEP